MNLMTDSPLHQLTVGQRHTLRVLRQHRWNYKAAAGHLQVSETSVRATVHRAVRRARLDGIQDLAYWLGREDERTL